MMKAGKKGEHAPLNNLQKPVKDVVDAGSDLSEKLKLKRAKSAESSKRTRDRQKAYIEQIELLMQQQRKHIESLIKEQNEAKKCVDSKADITNFGQIYRDWSYKFDNLIASLQRQMYLNSNPDHISPVIQLLNDHYLELLTTKKNAAKICVMSIINVTWMSPTLSCVMWIGGIRPSDIIKIILNHIELSNQQLEKIELLKVQTIEQEKTITYQVNTLKDEISEIFGGSKFVDRGDHEAMSNFKNNMFKQIG
ncbi:TGACG-sequence-specific DNA-binding protein TGA-2.1-like isoform X2 [Rutidosis leptorrhynchoides]|uniref:TGACG-sequence-specific DNA-binding protein TGA-2.1-like isoform X2 n=1 Tax=Rutidosis leptorrhynchoides TaxID=125765 RepID=UPI003A990560